MYVRVLSTGSVFGAELFCPRSIGCCPIDSIGREARTCRHMAVPFSLNETRGCCLPGTRYQVYQSTVTAARGTRPLLTTNMRCRGARDGSRRIGIHGSVRHVANAGALAIALRPSRTIHVYYEKDTYGYHKIITTLCRCTSKRLEFVHALLPRPRMTLRIDVPGVDRVR